MSRHEETGEEGLLTGRSSLPESCLVQLVGESPIRVNAREPGSYLGYEIHQDFHYAELTLIRKLLFV